MSYHPMHGWCMGSTDLKRRSARNCAELTLFAPPRLKSPSVTVSSTHGVSRSTCRLHIPSSPCCGRCLVSRVPSPALRAGSSFLLLVSLIRALGQTRAPEAYNCEHRLQPCLHNRWLRRHCCWVRLRYVTYGSQARPFYFFFFLASASLFVATSLANRSALNRSVFSRR